MHRVLPIFLVALLAAPALRARAQAPAPLLQQISDETQALYEHIGQRTVHVQMPAPLWAMRLLEQQSPFRKLHPGMDPNIRRHIEELMTRSPVEASIEPNTQPETKPDGKGARVVPRPDGSFEIVEGTPAAAGTAPATGPRMVGLVLDDQGHVLVPFFIEPEAVGNAPLRAWTRDGEAAHCTFVGSDRSTNLTILKLDAPQGKPVELRGQKPADGALVMFMGSAGESQRLLIWSGGHQENGLVIGMDGAVLGLCRFGQFLAADQCRPIVEQIIEHGSVQRAELGVMVRQHDLPGGRQVVRVDRVKPGSAAEKAGLQAGDFILSIAGEAISDLPTFAAAIALRRGATPLQIRRGNDLLEVTVDLQPKQ